MPEVVKKFILGKDKIPDWFNEMCSKGRCKLVYDEGDLVGVDLFTPTGTKLAKLNDVIMLGKSGMFFLTGEQAKNYGVQKSVKEENNRVQ